MTKIEEYALKLVADGAESYVEDDIDEDGEFDSEDDWQASLDLAYTVVGAIRANPELMLRLAREELDRKAED